MKLYLTQILKEANEAGFAVQGGNSATTAFSNTGGKPIAPVIPPKPSMSPSLGMPANDIQLPAATSLTHTIN